MDSAGISIRIGPRTDHGVPWRVLTERRLAALDPESPLYLVRWPGFVGLDSIGRVFVYNEEAERVEVFDHNGLFLAGCREWAVANGANEGDAKVGAGTERSYSTEWRVT